MIDRQQFVEAVVAAFPSLEADMRDETWVGLVHLEASAFARYTQEQIDTENRVELKRCFEFARRFLLEGTDDLKNAIAVSYLEHLNLSDQKRNRSWALEEMPEVLKREFDTERCLK
jgi:hypothetical protein